MNETTRTFAGGAPEPRGGPTPAGAAAAPAAPGAAAAAAAPAAGPTPGPSAPSVTRPVLAVCGLGLFALGTSFGIFVVAWTAAVLGGGGPLWMPLLPGAQVEAAACGKRFVIARVPAVTSRPGPRLADRKTRLLQVEDGHVVAHRLAPSFTSAVGWGPRVLAISNGRICALEGPDDVPTPDGKLPDASTLTVGGDRLWLLRPAQKDPGSTDLELLAWDGKTWSEPEPIDIEPDSASGTPSLGTAAEATLAWWKDRHWLFWKGNTYVYYATRTPGKKWSRPECVAAVPRTLQALPAGDRLLLLFSVGDAIPNFPTRIVVAAFDGQEWAYLGGTPRTPFGITTDFRGVSTPSGPVLITDDTYGVRLREILGDRVGPVVALPEVDYTQNAVRAGWLAALGLLVVFTPLMALVSWLLNRWKVRALPAPQERVQAASLFTRYLAQVIDVSLFWAPASAVFFLALARAEPVEGAMMRMQGPATMGAWAVAFVGYFIYSCVGEARWGRTLGKYLLGLRVVDTDLAPLSWSKAIFRTLLRVLDLVFLGYFAGALALAATRKWQRLGDLICGTVVVRNRTLEGAP